MLPLSRLDCPLSLKTPNMGNPGLQVSIGCLSFDIEVTRFIKDACLENELEIRPDENCHVLLIPMPNKSPEIWSKIRSKIKQLKEDTNGIILLHSSNIGVDYIEFGKNAQYISSLGEKLSAVIFVDSWTNAKVVPNPSARIPPHELSPVLQRIVESIKRPTHDWVVDLQRICGDHYHLYH